MRRMGSISGTFLAVPGLMLLFGLPALSQQVSVSPNVFSEVNHDVSRPLRDIAPVPPEAGPPREMHRHEKIGRAHV